LVVLVDVLENHLKSTVGQTAGLQLDQ
jgi:hypothetical protein